MPVSIASAEERIAKLKSDSKDLLCDDSSMCTYFWSVNGTPLMESAAAVSANLEANTFMVYTTEEIYSKSETYGKAETFSREEVDKRLEEQEKNLRAEFEATLEKRLVDLAAAFDAELERLRSEVTPGSAAQLPE